MKKLFALLFVCLIGAPAIWAQEENSLLWEIRDPQTDHISYLFGTYHLVGSDYLKYHENVKQAYEGASQVVVETVLDSTAIMQVAMQGMMPGNSLKAMVDSADYHLLKTKLEPIIGYDLVMFDQMKPIMLSTMYSMALAEEATPESFNYAGDPIDMYFAAHGKLNNKTIVSLESALEQAEILFNSETVEEQAKTLVQMVKEEDEAEELTQEIIKAYQSADLNAMWEQTTTLGDTYGDMDVLLNDRNKNWIPKLDDVLKKGDAFIAVGALHLPGEEGLIKLLEAKGYILSPVK